VGVLGILLAMVVLLGREPVVLLGGNPAVLLGGNPAVLLGGDPAALLGGDPAVLLGGGPAVLLGGEPPPVDEDEVPPLADVSAATSGVFCGWVIITWSLIVVLCVPVAVAGAGGVMVCVGESHDAAIVPLSCATIVGKESM